MAHTKAGGSTKLGRDSAGKRLGVKRSGGTVVRAGEIIVRQRGQKMIAGAGTIAGRDFTIQADRAGKVVFAEKAVASFTGHKSRKSVVSIEPLPTN